MQNYVMGAALPDTAWIRARTADIGSSEGYGNTDRERRGAACSHDVQNTYAMRRAQPLTLCHDYGRNAQKHKMHKKMDQPEELEGGGWILDFGRNGFFFVHFVFCALLN